MNETKVHGYRHKTTEELVNAPKILSPKEITGNRDTPFERLRKQVRESVLEDERRLKQSKLIAECERLSRLNKNDKIK